MNKRLVLLLSLMSFGALSASAQSVPDKLDKLAKDPKTAENAAKADVRLHDKKQISDSTQLSSQAAPATSKKKKCKKTGKS